MKPFREKYFLATYGLVVIVNLILGNVSFNVIALSLLHWSIVIVPLYIFLAFSLWIYRGLKGDLKKEKQGRANPPQVVAYTDDIREAFKREQPEVNEVLISNRERPEGALLGISPYLLQLNREKIRMGISKRSDQERRDQDVYMFAETQRAVKGGDGGYLYLYHRTHLLPFRFTLSEDLPGLLFTGTARLNSGDRPLSDYIVKEIEGDRPDSNSNRVRRLLFLMERNPKVEEIYIDKKNFFSLDDVERAVSKVIERGSGVFTYGVFCNYKDRESPIPESVTAILKDQKGRTLLEITLPNIE